MIIIEEHKLIRNLGNDLPFVRKIINKSSFFFFLKRVMVSIAGLQVLYWGPGREKDPSGARGCST